MTAPIRNLDLKVLSRLWFTGSITEVDLHKRFGIRANDPVIQTLREQRRIEPTRTPRIRPCVHVPKTVPHAQTGEPVVIEDALTPEALEAVRFTLATLRITETVSYNDVIARFGAGHAALAKDALLSDDLITVNDDALTARTIYAIDTDEAQKYLATVNQSAPAADTQPIAPKTVPTAPAADPNAFPTERLNALGDDAWEKGVYQLIADTDRRGGYPVGDTPKPATQALLDSGWARRHPDTPSLVEFRSPKHDDEIRRELGDEGFRRVVQATAAVVMLLSERADSLDILRATYGDQVVDLATVRLSGAVIKREDKGWSLLPKGQRPAFFTAKEKAKLRADIAEAKRRMEEEHRCEEADRRAAAFEKRRAEDPAFAELADRVTSVDQKLDVVSRNSRESRDGVGAIYESVKKIEENVSTGAQRTGRVYAQPTDHDVAVRILEILLVEGHKTRNHFTSRRFKGPRQPLVGPALDLLVESGAVRKISSLYMLVDPTAFGYTAEELRERYEATQQAYASRTAKARSRAARAVDSVRDSQFVASVKSRVGGSSMLEALDA